MAEYLKRDFTSLAEAFEALPAKTQEHGRRVGEYMRILFLQACSSELYASNQKAAVRLKEDYHDLVTAIGCYHDIGKAFVPELYHRLAPEFSPEEVALYRKHGADSAKLAEAVLAGTGRYRALELNFIKEALVSHHERWDGTGFPEGLAKEDISILGRLLAVANALDHISAEKYSEQPFEYALEQIAGLSGTAFDPLICELLKPAKAKLKKIFNANITQTKAIPVTETFIRRSARRPFALWYRPVTSRKEDKTVAYEAVIRFRDKSGWQEYREVEHLIRREKLTDDLGVYMLLEGCDTINRLDACRIPAEFIALELPAGWLNRRGAYRDVAQVLDDQAVSAHRICIVVAQRTWIGRTKTMQENLHKLRELGCRIMAADISPESIGEELRDLGITEFRLSADMLDAYEEGTDKFQRFIAGDVHLVADSIEKKKYQSTLNKLGVIYATGPLSGDYIMEDDLVERGLAEQEL